MKTMKVLFIALMLVSISANAQTTKKNNNKIKIGISGFMLISGSVVNIARVYTKEPTYEVGDSPEVYVADKKRYDKAQKDLQAISSIMYGIGGVSLITIKFDF